MKIRNAVITGPTGAVGVALIQELIANDIEVTAVCRRGSKRIGSIPKDPHVRVVECNLDEVWSLPDILGVKPGSDSDGMDSSYDAFYHFGWDGTYGDTRQDLALQTKNIIYTIDAVHAAKKLGCCVFIGAGSQSEFGHVDGVLHPDMPCDPDNGYGIAKLAAGRMSRIECERLGIRHEWCRIVSLYGPYDGEYTMVMSNIIKMCRGETPKCTKGDQVWDYIYSKDAARAFRLVAERGKDGAVYCFGTGRTRLLRDYIYAIRDAVKDITGVSVEPEMGAIPYYPNQVMHLEADISNLTEDTGFIPEYSFEQGIRETIKWYKHS